MINVFTIVDGLSVGQTFKIGFPIAKSQFYAGQLLDLDTPVKDALAVTFTITSLWPDKSIKWLVCEGIALQALEKGSEVNLLAGTLYNSPMRDEWVKQSPAQLSLSTSLGPVNFELDDSLRIDYLNDAKALLVTEIEGETCRLSPIKTQYKSAYDQKNRPLLCKVSQNAELIRENAENLNVTLLATVFYENASIELTLSIHNPSAIVHHGGKWDLGNESSVYLKSFALELQYQSNEVSFQPYEQASVHACKQVSMLQFSSGGKNWNSINHKNRHNEVALKQQHATINGTDSHNKPFKQTHKRLAPCVTLNLPEVSIQVSPTHFWQKFPASITCSPERTMIDFAPSQAYCEVELQAGETKSHQINISGTLGSLQAKSLEHKAAHIVVAKENVFLSRALAFLQNNDDYQNNGEHDEGKLLIDPQGWIDKRESLDEYGWRNFGDIYADHEAAHYTGDGTFVSHYNNQYDPLYGFLKSWMLKEDAHFKGLADELFDHLINIDIYRTNKDKPDYNYGLFWHTDHYVPAETASHRTYSARQDANVYIDHAGSGGPGPHHCYSSGMALYYQLTGDPRAKEATLGLCKWMLFIFEGDGTLLGSILRMKNANALKLPFTDKLLLGFGTGVVRNIFTNKYPLDRGTGNLVNVLLDAYIVSDSWQYIEQAEFVILNTISDQDDISKRNFEDIETTWFYTVFLQAVSKYLFHICQRLNDSDTQSKQVRSVKIVAIKKAFLHYIEWMTAHEQLYLSSPDKLEYPNDTWTGQDLRKVQLLLCGFEICKNEAMRNKARSLKSEIVQMLSRSTELSFARIQALLMQNTVDENAIKGMFDNLRSVDEIDVDDIQNNADISHMVNKSKTRRVVMFIKSYSFKRELDLLCVRIPIFRKLLKR